MRTLRFKLVGLTPLIFHNARLARPTDPIAKAMKEVADRKGKTETDLEELAKLEFAGAMYLHPSTKEPVIPASMLYSCLLRGARKSKGGKTIEAGVSFPKGHYPLTYDGPRDWEALYAFEKDGERPFVDQRMVVIQRSRVLRTRPIFNEWALELDVTVNEDVLEPSRLLQFWADAGTFQRLGDGRVLGFGAFSVIEV